VDTLQGEKNSPAPEGVQFIVDQNNLNRTGGLRSRRTLNRLRFNTTGHQCAALERGAGLVAAGDEICRGSQPERYLN
jgi:hypothetical protein